MTFDEWWKEESGWDDGGPLLAEGHLSRAAWEAALKNNKTPVAEVPCSVGLEGQLLNAKDIIKRILELPKVEAEFEYLDKGIGTKTIKAVLLEARELITEKAD